MAAAPLSQEEIQFLCDIAAEAGAMAAEMRATIQVTQKTGPHDLVTNADIKLSHFLIEQMEKRFPDDVFISEEGDLANIEIPSEEEHGPKRVWLIDPIDGTENYIKNDSAYAVMIGAVYRGSPVFGCVYAPEFKLTMWGGPAYGAWKTVGNEPPQQYPTVREHQHQTPTRVMMAHGDRKRNPDLKGPDIEFIPSGSVGLKVAKVLEDEADMYVHLARRLKVWDTAAPGAIAIAAGMECGSLSHDMLSYNLPEFVHEHSVIMGRPGSLRWAREKLLRPQVIE